MVNQLDLWILQWGSYMPINISYTISTVKYNKKTKPFKYIILNDKLSLIETDNNGDIKFKKV